MVFQDEQSHALLTWGGDPYEITHWRTSKVHPDHHAACKYTFYSVPASVYPPGQKVEVATSGVAGFNPNARRDRNLVNRELSDLAGHTTQGHSKPSPQLIMRVSRGRYLYREPDRPMDAALLQEYLEPVEAYEKRPARRRGDGNRRPNVPEAVRMALYLVQRGVCPGCGFHQPHHLRFEIDHIVALSDDGEHETRNLQLLCGYCNRVKGTQGSHGFRMKMAELRAHNVGTGVMVDEREAVLTSRRLAQHHLESGNAAP